MGRSAGRRAYEAYEQLPEGVKKHADRVIRLGAKATRRLRNRGQIEAQGRAFTEGLKRRIVKAVRSR